MENFKILTVPRWTDPYEGSEIYYFLDSLKKNAGSYDFIVFPEYAFCSNTGLIDECKKSFFLEQMIDLTLNKNSTVFAPMLWTRQNKLYNSCFVISDGELIFEYYKQTSFKENDIAKSNGLKYSLGNIPGILEHKDMHIGIELCMDHYSKKLKNSLRSASIDGVDIHFVLSCGMFYIDSSDATADDGICIVCDGNSNRSTAVQNGMHVFGKSVSFGTEYHFTRRSY